MHLGCWADISQPGSELRVSHCLPQSVKGSRQQAAMPNELVRLKILIVHQQVVNNSASVRFLASLDATGLVFARFLGPISSRESPA